MALRTATRLASTLLIPILFLSILDVDPLVSVASGFTVAGAITLAVGLVCIFRATHSPDYAVEPPIEDEEDYDELD